MSTKVNGPLFKWFGSKWQISRYYPAPHGNKIIEPFAGGAGYSLRYNTEIVKVAETDLHIYELWRWFVENAQSEDVTSIPVGLPVGMDIRSLPMKKEQQLLLKNWQRTNNVGDCWTISPWGNMPGQWTESTRSRVSRDIQAVKHWEVFKDGFELLESDLKNDPKITWFIDPPYLYNYRYGAKNEFNYEKLSADVDSLAGQVIVCEAICPKTGKEPDYLPFQFFRKSITSRRAKGSNIHSKELLYHRPSKGAEA